MTTRGTVYTTALTETPVSASSNRLYYPSPARIAAYKNTLADYTFGSWSSGFVNWSLAQNGVSRTNLRNPRSWLNYNTPLVIPDTGCITVTKKSNEDLEDYVGFYTGVQTSQFILLYGTVGDASIGKTWHNKRNVLGFREIG